jgi:hypothetical protein
MSEDTIQVGSYVRLRNIVVKDNLLSALTGVVIARDGTLVHVKWLNPEPRIANESKLHPKDLAIIPDEEAVFLSLKGELSERR